MFNRNQIDTNPEINWNQTKSIVTGVIYCSILSNTRSVATEKSKYVFIIWIDVKWEWFNTSGINLKFAGVSPCHTVRAFDAIEFTNIRVEITSVTVFLICSHSTQFTHFNVIFHFYHAVMPHKNHARKKSREKKILSRKKWAKCKKVLVWHLKSWKIN